MRGRKSTEPSEKLTSILSGDSEDLRRIRELKELLNATSDRETVRRAVIFCSVMIHHQECGGEIVLCRKGVADKAVWMI